jgi:hypothetical protein
MHERQSCAHELVPQTYCYDGILDAHVSNAACHAHGRANIRTACSLHLAYLTSLSYIIIINKYLCLPHVSEGSECKTIMKEKRPTDTWLQASVATPLCSHILCYCVCNTASLVRLRRTPSECRLCLAEVTRLEKIGASPVAILAHGGRPKWHGHLGTHRTGTSCRRRAAAGSANSRRKSFSSHHHSERMAA